MTYKVFNMPRDSVVEIMEYLRQTAGKVTDEEFVRSRTILEETFLRLQAGMNDPAMTATVKIQKRFGDVSLIISAHGEAVNPIMDLTEWVEDEIDVYSANVLKANRDRMGYSRKNGANVISIKVHERSVNVPVRMLSAVVLGIVCGYILKSLASPGTIHVFDEYLMEPIAAMFIHAVDMMIAPVVFFNIMAGITKLAETADIGKIGTRLVAHSVTLMAISAIISLGLCFLLFSEEMAQLAPMFEANGGKEVTETLSFKELLVDIVPENVIDPFRGENLLQVLFLAILFGVIINRLAEYADTACNFIEFMSRFCTKVMETVCAFEPIVVFVAMMEMALNLEPGIFIDFGKVILCSILGLIVSMGLYGLFLRVYGGINPRMFFRKIIPFSSLPFANTSSSSSLPHTLEFAHEKLGIASNLASFSVPVGINLHMAGACYFLAAPAVMMIQVLGVPVNLETLLCLALYVCILPYIMPPVAGGGVIALATVFAVVGVPPSAVVFFIFLEHLTGMFETVNNVMANVASSLLLAKKCDMWDEKVYSAEE